jgi:8-amino-7-oxononanoate synthase
VRALALAARFRWEARLLELHLTASESPIQPVILGSADAAVRAQNELLDSGFLVVAIRPPTVPAGTARLRITFTAAHTEAQVDALVEALGRIHYESSKTSRRIADC